MSRPARLADVARQAGVSEATASRVFNGKPGVAAATRASVLEALDLLGYDRPSRLRERSAGLVGLIVPELSNPVFPAYAQVIENALSASGYTPVLCTQAPGGVHEDEYVEMLLERGVSGIIYVSGHHANLHSDIARYLDLVAKGIPIVLVSGFREGIPAPFVSNDERVAMSLVVDHLTALRHRRIGLLVGPERYVPVMLKIASFRQSMHEIGDVDDLDDLVVETFFTVEGGASGAAQLLDRGCTAIVCASDLMALGAISEVRRRGLRVPDDVSVVGSDDSWLMAYTDPPLTTVRVNVTAMGEAAVEALLTAMSGEPSSVAELVFRPELVVRGSTGPAPAASA
ncbi:DNA-binding LacI/PurR family transcriptional regulator [Kineosphaera limosa]|uniref:Putative LacI family transcriptional regulator n=1 Tax=Kineosphaera limosa NBRC 100340 TaxID=1184609 RepID=K6WPV3_9MICO|nr:LacI family DNA-binding transcriptional regulator [Kineosphaera limosa]NYD99721.1 DNA-binding LacI/PurR family transcriptional regulator [Kineosphaera limosa]GAB95821.1 putative LacI family transcriptional regulator [Kineosphaera limosa NBRC 100340]